MPERKDKPGLLALVIDSGLAVTQQGEYIRGGAKFTKARLITDATLIPKTIRTIWVEGSLSDEEKARLKQIFASKLNLKKVAYYEKSTGLVSLKDRLNRRLKWPDDKPSGNGHSDFREELPEQRRLRELKSLEFEPVIRESHNLRLKLERAEIEIELYQRQLKTVSGYPSSAAQRDQMENLVSALQKSEFEKSETEKELRKLKATLNPLRQELSNRKDALNELVIEARCLMVNYKTVLSQSDFSLLTSKQVGWLKKVEKQFEDHVYELEALLKGMKEGGLNEEASKPRGKQVRLKQVKDQAGA